MMAKDLVKENDTFGWLIKMIDKLLLVGWSQSFVHV
jgi:hypothetical protein